MSKARKRKEGPGGPSAVHVVACGRVWRLRRQLRGGLTTRRLQTVRVMRGEGAMMAAMFDAALMPGDRQRAAEELRWSERQELFQVLVRAYATPDDE